MIRVIDTCAIAAASMSPATRAAFAALEREHRRIRDAASISPAMHAVFAALERDHRRLSIISALIMCRASDRRDVRDAGEKVIESALRDAAAEGKSPTKAKILKAARKKKNR